MAKQDAKEWLKSVVRKAAKESLGEEPEDVLIHESHMTVVMGGPFKPTHKVWARVIMAEHSHEIFLNAAADGSYDDFKILKSFPQ